MKILFIGIILSVCSLKADNLFSPDTRITLKRSSAALEQIIEEIEKQSPYLFVYTKDVNIRQEYVVDTESSTLRETLDKLFSGTDIRYEVEGSYIVLSAGKEAPERSAGIALVRQQAKRLTGTVTDESGEPLAGASVVEKNTTNGIITDVDGRFTLNVREDAVLQISYIGYITQEVTAGSQTVLQIKLKEDRMILEELVVVGYGTARKSELTSAISRLSGEALQARPVTRLDQALQGEMAGVHVQQSGGKPGKNARIRVRGVNTITAQSDPLFVVDGFPVDAETFANINMDDVESVEVLKDAASASIYGSRGSGGVVIVTTKRGTKGEELKLDFNAYAGFSRNERTVKFMSAADYVLFMADSRTDGYIQQGGDLSVAPIDRPWDYKFDQDLVDLAKTNPSAVPSYDPMGAILQTGVTRNYQLSATGATEKVRYLISGGYYSQSGIIQATDYKRYNLRANVDVEVNKYITIGMNMAPSYVVSHDIDSEGKGGAVHNALGSVPIIPPRQGYWGESELFSAYNLSYGTYQTLALIEHLDDEVGRFQGLGDVYAEITFFPGLKWKTSFGATFVQRRNDRFMDKTITREAAPQGKYTNQQYLNYLNENVLIFNKTFQNKHALGALIGFTVQDQKTKNSEITGTNFANDLVPTLNAAGSWTASTTMSEWTLLSYLGRINYTFHEKYLFGASLRSDGSSRFGENTKWGLFPSLSAGWRIDGEAFMKSLEIINRLKLRASWGKTGNNNIPDYRAIPTMGNTSYYYGTDKTKTTGMYIDRIANPNLGWEKTSAADLGLDIGLWSNRLSLTVDFYNNQTSDLLLDVPVPAITGFTTELQNIGQVENKGWEFEVSSINMDSELKWTTHFNLSFNKNTVKKLGDNDAPIYSGDWFDMVTITTVGKPIGSFYVYKQTGVYKDQAAVDADPAKRDGTRPGDVIIEDYNRDGKLDSNDRQIFGSNIPKYTFGITNQFAFKGIDFSFFLSGVGGNQIFNTYGREFNRPSDSHKNHYPEWVNRWRSPEEPGDGMTPRATDRVTGMSNEYTQRWIYDGAYVRLKNITIGYTLPSRWLGNRWIAGARCYLAADNVFIWDHYPVGFTPEVDLNDGESIRAGRDYFAYPMARNFLFGVNVSF
jgi:TonB-linked SusC/RagA family outer membrane protein